MVRVVFRRAGVGGVLLRLKTRPPRPDDLAEQRLANLVQEVAVAAGVPPPRVLLVDAKASNAGAAGLTMADATVVATRGFATRLPRDAQQAVLAHVMASVGNGDLTIAAEILTLLQTWGLVSLLLEAPMVPQARASLRQVGGTARDVFRAQADAASRDLAVDTLLAGATFENLDSDEFERLPDAHPLVVLFVYGPVLMTLGPAAIAGKAIIWLTTFVLSPFVSLLWRTRRKLADATAVQLTRHPGALADALRTLAGINVKVPRAVAVHWLFPVWDPKVDEDHTREEVTSVLLHMHLPLEPRLRRLERLGAAPGGKRLKKRDPGLTWREVAAGAGWIGVGAGMLAGAVALSAVGAAAVLWFLGWLLDRTLGAFSG
jgi:Zn-dependent protease with chaperone function